MSNAPSQIVIVTGLSGSGKSTALRALEDVGYFCIDNLPIVLLPRLLDLGTHASDSVSRLALGVDAREVEFLSQTPRVLQDAREEGHQVSVLYLDARDEVLLRRFSETRRRHPLAERGSVEEGIVAERTALAELESLADEVIDTSQLTVHELKRLVQDRFSTDPAELQPSVTLLSFGFKHGLPPQADLVIDCRFLPNPHFVEHLKPLTGLEDEVSSFVLERPETGELLGRLNDLLTWLVPKYRQERKAYVTVAVGCTGGRHRSVAIAERLGADLKAAGLTSRVRHRDISK